MAYQLSPGVNVSEIDLTTIVPAVGSTEAAFAGQYVWGPVDEIVMVSNEVQLVDRFGKPDSNTFVSFFTASNFLNYGRNLRIVRAANTAMRNATSGNTAVLIKNQSQYEVEYLDLSANATIGMFAARYAGSIGNSLEVHYAANSAGFTAWSANTEFTGAPGTSAAAAAVGGSGDEMHIMVVDKGGQITGVPGTVLEKFPFVSKAIDAKNDDGSSNYYVNVINDRSKFIYVMNKATGSNWGLAAGTTFTNGANGYMVQALSGGVTAAPTNGELLLAYEKFKNTEEIDISLILTGDHPQTVVSNVIDNVVEFRRDCVIFISPAFSDVVNNAGNETTSVVSTRNLYNSTSYAFMDSGWKYQFDKYNNVYRWIPLNADMAGLCVRTDFDRDPWFSPAGFNRGSVKNVTKLSWNPNRSERDELYKSGVNPVVSFPGQGVILYGDKTMLDKPSAFDRINVRRLFIVLEKAIARAAKYSLFEFNDEFTRAQFVALVEPFLRDVKGRRGIFDYRVVCDSTNNTPEVIDRNEFVGDIYIKPARSINFIQLNFVAVRTGVAFEEIVGRF